MSALINRIGEIHGDLRITSYEIDGNRTLWNAVCVKCGKPHPRARRMRDIEKYNNCPHCSKKPVGHKIIKPWESKATEKQVDRVYRFFVQMRPLRETT